MNPSSDRPARYAGVSPLGRPAAYAELIGTFRLVLRARVDDLRAAPAGQPAPPSHAPSGQLGVARP